MEKQNIKQPVIIIQDGAVDELMSVALVATMPNIDLLGIGVVNADCLADPTLEVTQKILNLMVPKKKKIFK